MTINIVESVRKMMGWCPQQENNLFQEQTKFLIPATSLNFNPPLKSIGSIKQIDVPMYMTDWRMVAILIAVFLSFFIASLTDHLYRTPLSFIVTMLIMVTLIVLLFLSKRYIISINSEELQIKTPLLSSIKIPKSQIKSVKNIDNIIYKQKHSWVNTVFILSILFFILIQSLLLYQQISRSSGLEDTVMSISGTIFLVSLFIIMFYRHSHLSNYPKAIQINAGNKNITLCPRNESEFNLLKEELER